jgi:hypothetical protein
MYWKVFGCACMTRCPKPEDGCTRSSKATSTTMRYLETSQVWARSVTGCWRYGGVLFAAGGRNTDYRGHGSSHWLRWKWRPDAARVAKLASEGKSVRAAEDIPRSEGFNHCDHVTVAADLKLEYQRLNEATKAMTEKHRQRV